MTSDARTSRNHRRHTLQSVPQPTPGSAATATTRTETEEKLWQVIHANPNRTTHDLAELASIGRSTAGKILARWATAGSVSRTPGIAEGGKRAADLWAITNPDTTPDSATPPVEATIRTQSMAADNAQPTADRPATTPDHGTPPEAQTSQDMPPTPADEQQKPSRLAPGALRGLIEDFLRDHPDEEFSPSKIGKALNRSPGAVNNALEKLVGSGYAVQSTAKPKRFQFAGTDQIAATTSGDEGVD